MAVTVKAAGFAVLLRVVVGFGVVAGFDRMQTVFVPVLEVVAVATMVFGNLVALVQQSVKRMLAYSAIAHTGYLLVGVVASAYAENGAAGGSAAAATLFYLVPYSLMSLGAFALLGHVSKNGEDRERFEDYRGLAQERPFLALGLLVILVSFAGIPPTAGFWGKLLVFRAAVLSGHWFLALVGILTSVVSLAYYLRLVVNFYMRPAEAPFGGDSEAPPRLAGTLVIAAAAVLIIVLGVFPGWGVELSEISAQALVRKH
jgi:NADH-quinone oxidoreductase subunit N